VGLDTLKRPQQLDCRDCVEPEPVQPIHQIALALNDSMAAGDVTLRDEKARADGFTVHGKPPIGPC